MTRPVRPVRPWSPHQAAVTMATMSLVAFGLAALSAVGAAQKTRQDAAASQPGSGKAGSPLPLAITIIQDQGRLPGKVVAMREAILAAARSGDIEALRTPLEWNELPPEISASPAGDPIAHWKGLSTDGRGRQILAVLVSILESAPIAVGAGTPSERYIWPGFAEMDLGALTPAQEVQLYRLVTPAEAQAMREKKKWTWYRLSIGADGTWHSFLKAD